jgi:hypothetical protein
MSPIVTSNLNQIIPLLYPVPRTPGPYYLFSFWPRITTVSPLAFYYHFHYVRPSAIFLESPLPRSGHSRAPIDGVGERPGMSAMAEPGSLRLGGSELLRLYTRRAQKTTSHKIMKIKKNMLSTK